MPVNTQPTRGPKLRNSCDACNLAKVKCSKARPACARCQSHEVECVYGVSMRSGKHPANRNNLKKRSSESPQSTDILRRGSVLTDTSPLLTEEKSNIFEHSASSMVDHMDLNDDWTNLSQDANGLHSLESLMHVDDSVDFQQNYPDSYGGDLFPGLDAHCVWSGTHSAPQDLFYTEPRVLPIPLSTPRTPETPPAFIAQVPQIQSKATALPSCFCHRRVLQQLFELSKSSGISTSFDIALNHNKEVISLCHNILSDRTCSRHDTSYFLTFAALIARIISIYESIYPKHHQSAASPKSSTHSRSHTWNADDDASVFASEPDDSQSVCNSANPSNPGSHWSTTFPSTLSLPSIVTGRTATAPVRLTLGAYKLDHEDEEKLKIEIFNIELSKVGSLIRAFGQRYGSNKSQLQYEAKVDEDMVALLEKRLWDSLERLRG